MASIESLLNPLPDRIGSKHHQEDDANISYFHRSSITSLPDRRMSANTFSQSKSQTTSNKKPRIAKDAPIFIPGSVRGEVRYPPCADPVEATMAEEHAKFSLYPPVDEIADYPRHIPYSSEKKSLMEKTGRESFEGMFSSHLVSLLELIGLIRVSVQYFNIRSSCLVMRRSGR